MGDAQGETQEGGVRAQRGGRLWSGCLTWECNRKWAHSGEVRQRDHEHPGPASLRGGLPVESTAWVGLRGLRGDVGPRLSWVQLVMRAEGGLVRAVCMSSTRGPRRIWGSQHVWSRMAAWAIRQQPLPCLLFRDECSALQEPVWCRSGETKAFPARRTEGSAALPAPPPHHLQSSAAGTAGVGLWEEPVP